MKKILFAIASLALIFSCVKEEQQPVQNDGAFRIEANLINPDTKTVFNPTDNTVAWEDTDALTVLVNDGTAYAKYKFTKVSGVDNAFECSGFTPAAEKDYTYSILYPYNGSVKKLDDEGFTTGDNAYVELPTSKSSALVQADMDDAAHVKGALYAQTTAVGTEKPVVTLSHFTHIMRAKITNNTGAAVVIESVTMANDASQNLSGSYMVNLSNGAVKPRDNNTNYVAKSVKVDVTDGTLAAGATGTVYIVTPEFTIPEGNKISFTVKCADNAYEVEKAVSAETVCAAGGIRTANISLKASAVVKKETIADILENGVEGAACMAEGTIVATNKDGFVITDESGAFVYVYQGTAQGTGVRGNVVKVDATLGSYNTVKQLTNPTVTEIDGTAITPTFTELTSANASALLAQGTLTAVSFKAKATDATKFTFGYDSSKSGDFPSMLSSDIMTSGLEYNVKAIYLYNTNYDPIIPRFMIAEIVGPPVVIFSTPAAFKADAAESQVLTITTKDVANPANIVYGFAASSANADKFTQSVAADGKSITVATVGANSSDAAYTATLIATYNGEVIGSVDLTQSKVLAAGSLVSDVINREKTGVTGTTYASVTINDSPSGAVYSVQCAGGNSSVQLRSKNSNSGIVATTSGGKARKVSVVWNDKTSANRTIEIYGSSQAYTAPTDLYDATKEGTSLGTIKYAEGEPTELTIAADYEYIGIRSVDGALYLTSITIEWEK